jgi:DNA-binding helix-hairpin-helix protein with protein kinase domain
MWLLTLGGLVIAWWQIGGIADRRRQIELDRRSDVADKALHNYQALFQSAYQDAARTKFETIKKELSRLRNEHQSLEAHVKHELNDVYKLAEIRQKQKYLEQFYIETASIPGISYNKKAVLRSFGIETAADVTWDKVNAIKGFGKKLTRAVVDWRQSHERNFVFNRSIGVTQAEINQAKSKVVMQQRAIMVKINGGKLQMQQIRDQMVEKAKSLESALQQAQQELEQAVADFKAI